MELAKQSSEIVSKQGIANRVGTFLGGQGGLKPTLIGL